MKGCPTDHNNALLDYLGGDIAFENDFEPPSVVGTTWKKEVWALCKKLWMETGVGMEAKRKRWWSAENRGEQFRKVRTLTLLVIQLTPRTITEMHAKC